MSYDSKLAQTGKRVASARRKYYGSFDYGSGLSARFGGGAFSFGRKFGNGGTEDWIDEPEVQALIEKYWRKHPNDAWKFNKNPETGLGYGEEFGEDSLFQGSPWGTIAKVGVDTASGVINNVKDMQDIKDNYEHKFNTFGTSEFSGLTDNSALLSTMANTPLLSGPTAKSLRNKSVGQDVVSILGTGIGATISSGGNYLVGLGAMGMKGAQVGYERWNAKNTSRELAQEARRRNKEFFKNMGVAAQDVDARNDWMRMYGDFNMPFDYAFGGPLHSNGGDYNGGLTFIDEGGRHEDNPYEGVPSGVDSQGNPNLVEEGEAIWNNDYVFSDRIKVPAELKKKYKLGGNKDITFADAIEKLTKESRISPNDPITTDTTKAIVEDFMIAQEAIRGARQMAAKEELEAAQADNFLAQLDAAQGMGMPMMGGQGMTLPSMGGVPTGAPVTEGGMNPPGMAFGGKKFDGGGWEDFFKMLEAYQGSLGESNATGKYAIDRNARYWNNRTAAQIEGDTNYSGFTKWVKEHSDDANVRKYFEYLDRGINKKKGAKTLLKYDSNGKVIGLADDWEKRFEHRRTDGDLGIYHLNPGDIGFLSQPATQSPANKQRALSELLNGTRFSGYLDGYPNIRTAVKDGKTYYLDPENNILYDNVNDVPGYKAPAAKAKSTTGTGVPIIGYPGILDMGDGTFWDENTGQYLSKLPGTEMLDESRVTATYDPKKGKKNIDTLNATTKDDIVAYKYRPTWQREIPVLGAGMDWLYRKLNRPDYTNADEVIRAARTLGTPISIPVETIGDYRKRNPFDERYLVNLANQNRVAATRGIVNTSGGNRAMDLLGNMALAHSNQADLGEIMRQAYLANRQDDAQVAEFNRGTNLYNMQAINQRNLSQAQLNSQRQGMMLSGLERGYTMRQNIKDNWDDAAMDSFNSMIASLGAIGKENEEYNMLTSMAQHGYYPYYYGDRGIMEYARPARNGGKLNRKKRRF